MQYNQPLDQPTLPNAPYIDGNPNAGIQGSIVPAASIEFDQREVVEVISRANIRGYKDFSDTPCAVPANSDLMQLRKAIEGFIRSIPSPPGDLIDSQVTFHVHGTGADFPDINAALEYLTKYKITHNGFVTLQIAAGKWAYSTMILIDHPNSSRLGFVGAQMQNQIPPPSVFAQNGNSAAQRIADTNTNLAMLRTKFSTELSFTLGCSVQINGTLAFYDSILHTGDHSTGPISDQQLLSVCGSYDTYVMDWQQFAQPPQGIAGGLACVNGNWGMTAIGGAESWGYFSHGPCVMIGNNNNGFVSTGRTSILFLYAAYAFSNGYDGFGNSEQSFIQIGSPGNYGVASSCNAANGISVALNSACYVQTGYIWKNASYACQFNQNCSGSLPVDFGMGTANANGAAAWAGAGSFLYIGGSANYGYPSPPLNGGFGNWNSVIYG
jgi:hypothetical protein